VVQYPSPALGAQAAPGPPIQDLPPIATPADLAAIPPPPDEAPGGTTDPNTGPSNIPVNAVQLAPPSAPPVIPAAGVVHVYPGLAHGLAGPPLDPDMAGGPSNVLEQVNGAVAVYDRSGNKLYGPATSAQYYGVSSGDIQGDPHTIFDPNGQRFIAIMMDATTKNWMVSITNTSDALSGRCIYTIPALNSGSSSIDFPLAAVSPKYLMLTIRENSGGTRLDVFNLATLENTCQPPSGWFWTNAGPSDTITPVMDYSLADTDSFLISSFRGGGSSVELYKINTANPPVLSWTNVQTPFYSVASHALQPSPYGEIDSGDAVIAQAVNYTHGMYATLTSGYPSGNAAIMWLEFNPETQQLVGNQVIYNGGYAMFNSSITEGSNGSTMFTYALSGPSTYPSSAVVGMDINHNITTDEFVVQGKLASPQYRWGDYTSTYTDYPLNTNTYWSASMFFANATEYGTKMAYGSA
jgi:hypothetical protein